MSPITTHVLDTALGIPAAGLSIKLEKQNTQGHWDLLAEGVTNADGRIMDLLSDGVPLAAGIYQLTFATGDYFRQQNRTTFYPHASVVFEVAGNQPHYHVPLLLSGYGYSTYRGS